MLREQFGLRNGKPEPTWEKTALATFARTHGHNDRDAVILDEDSWDELIENVAKIELDSRVARTMNWIVRRVMDVEFLGPPLTQTN